MAMAEQLALISERQDALVCSYLTSAHRATAALIRDWMLGAGLQVEIDAVGECHRTLARRRCKRPLLC